MVISINPSQSWQGNDGPWSTFTLGIGTPAQWVQVLISTTGVQPWVILSQGCTPIDPSTCGKSRGDIFYINESSTWQDEGFYELDLELNLNYTGNGDFGYDTLSLGLLGTGLPNMSHQVVAGIATKDFYLGSWGIAPYPTNLTTLDDPKPSLMSNLKGENLIPSLSYGYTAGAQYRLKGVPGSLTLGGYDASRFTPSSHSFGFAADTSRDLVVGINSISLSQSAKPTIDLLPTAILSFIDSTVPQIWLPLDACHEFERAFGISYDNDTKVYLVNDTLHDSLVARDASLTFTIATDTTSDETVNITLPYASFDLHVSYPIVKNGSSRYFPIRRADNSTQYTLGRTFLQEAYLTVDYERSNFSVHQCIFQENVPQNLIPILSANKTSNTTSSSSRPSSLSAGTDTAITIGALVVVLLAVGTWFLFRRRRRRRRREPQTHDVIEPPIPEFGQKAELDTTNIHELALSNPLTPEVEGTEIQRAHELYSPPEFTELPGGDTQVYELSGQSRRLERESNLSGQSRRSRPGIPKVQQGNF